MLGPILKQLASLRVILASGSPRRRELLSALQVKFDVVPSLFPETLDKKVFSKPQDYVVETSKRKAEEVLERLQLAGEPLDVVIGADTVIALDGEILEKPRNREHAVSILHRLSGRKHSVYTGVTLIYCQRAEDQSTPAPIVRTFHEETEVSFATLSDDVIEYYVSTGEPLDKAGAYGIQGIGGSLIEKISGDYYNVVGLPLHRLSAALVALLGTKCWAENRP